LLPLRTELKSGDIVEVITAPYSKPNPAWLGFVRTGKARSAIRHYLKTMRLNESVQLGERLVDQSLKGYGLSLAEIEPEVWEKLVQWTGNKNRQEIFADIGLGRRVAAVMAKRIEVLVNGREADDEHGRAEHAGTAAHPTPHAPPVVITGTEGMSVQLSACCRPIPGDDIMGYIGIGLGMAIHTTDCRVAQRIHRRDPGRWIDVAWAPQPGRLFDVAVKVLVRNVKGVFARVAADITSADANIVHIAMDEDLSQESTVLRFVIQVSDRVHLANVMRRVRTNPDVMRIARERPSEDGHHRHDGGMRIERERGDY
jgi:GTP pyrophosphokinase